MRYCVRIFLLSLLAVAVAAFLPPRATSASSRVNPLQDATVAESVQISMEPKIAVKVFGRLAEKYIMLDATGGMCCYSACSDCEYREPGGGYRMADQSSSRPKWIPVYDERKFETLDKEHTTKWSTELFVDGPALTKEEFCSRLPEMTFAPPLGGPYLSASVGKSLGGEAEEEVAAVEAMWDLFIGDSGKEKLTKFRMSKRLRELANGEEGLTWNGFSKCVGIE
uniref:Uncharacterized protein n=1 Tax=Grammatophora oceanica TaxID=210454 RepID=A0A7S1UTP4_9STRA|mmetsp:Transcript_19602/g.29003  ORF Transcript_19602/g.29003 Transcript_19602/m.29003 type:complete len:224 (+) Transcript_19602:75-746(+)|eukprot:CAMPEP_0194040824 /NCGR_PEP_ID=MMETSP0009_2-20130614/12770_1 /TAXON_ID=210454 /ORGANISM="Grammatophora oceanica, Strain CCMP 410" /LENGTH=223 /DNA_ID=CAMNT_0038684093 /DNA_START=35 /DNA_END=706 /DNA_ORIENTATION=-